MALPYGKPELSLTKSLEYGSLHQEAVKVFNVLLRLDEVRNPIPAVQVKYNLFIIVLVRFNLYVLPTAITVALGNTTNLL